MLGEVCISKIFYYFTYKKVIYFINKYHFMVESKEELKNFFLKTIIYLF